VARHSYLRSFIVRVAVATVLVAACVELSITGGVQGAAVVSATAVSPLETPENNAVDMSGTLLPPLRLQWHRSYQHYVAAALAAQGLVFMSAASLVYALDPSTGRRVWGPVDTCGAADGEGDEVRLAYDAGRLFVSTECAQVIAFAASTGHRLWSHYGHVVSAGYGAVFALTDSRITRLDERTGRSIWHFDHRFVALAAITTDEVVVAEYSDVWRLRLSDGAVLWHEGQYTETAQHAYPPVIAADRVVAFQGSGSNQAVIDRDTGEVLSTIQGDTNPAIVGNLAILRRGGSFVAIDLSSGATAWTFTGDGQLVSRAVVEDGDVYVASSLGHLWALNATDGTVLWQGSIPAGYGTVTLPGAGAVPGTAAMTIGQGLLLVPVDHQLLAFRSVAGAAPPATAARPQPALVATRISVRDASDEQADARHAGRTASPGLTPPLRKAWARDFAGPVSFALIGARRVFAVSDASGHSYLYGLSRRTGHTAWPRIDIGASDVGAGGPCMDDRRVYVTAHARSIAVDRRTGKVLWSKQIGARRDNVIAEGTSICTVANGTLYVEGRAYFLPGGGSGGAVFAVNAVTGHVRWATVVRGQGGMGPVAVLENTVLLNLSRFQAAFDATDGHELWQIDRGDGYSDEPAIGYRHRLWVLDDLDRARAIRSGHPHPSFTGRPAFYGNRMFLASEGELRSEDLATRFVIWRRHPTAPVTYPPFVVNRLVLAVTADGVLHAYNLRGTELWHGATGAPADLGGYLWPGTLYAEPQAAISAAHGTVTVPTSNRLTAWVGST
jgi:eukaryotic-like serine/threonine-protein kinase